MANNVILPGTGQPIATDDIGTAPNNSHYQRIKITDGLEESTVPARVKATNADVTDAGIVVRPTPQDTWSVSFTQVSASQFNSPEMTQRRLGAGMGVSQSAGNLVVTTGTTANSEFLARSTVTFNGALIERHQTILSQRIANNNFAVLLADRIAEGASCTINSATSITVTVTAHGFTTANVGQSMNVGAINGANGVPGRYAIASIPSVNTITFTVAGWPASGSCTVDLFGWNYVRWLYSGTTATAAAIDAQRYGWNSGDTTATINTTASPGHMAQTAIDGRNIYFSDTLVASSTTPAVAVRGHRYVNIPDDEIELFMYLWAFNGSTAPASTTTWTVGFVAVEDVVNTPVYLAGIRQQGFSSPLPVVFPTAQPVSGTFWQATQPVSLATNTPTLAAGTNLAADFGVQYRASATGAGTLTNVNCPATPVAQQLKGTAGRLIGIVLTNTSTSDRWLKLFNATSASVTPGTTSALSQVGIKAGQTIKFTFEGGAAFSTAITIMITGGQGLTNNTGVTLGDVTGFAIFA
jgi:hypothetical protein